jgi:hypothetical protein
VRRVEHLHPVGHLVNPVRVAGVVHAHPEHLPRRSHGLAAGGLADPAGAVDRGMLGGVGKDREDGLRWGINDRGRANGFTGHAGLLMS